MGKIALLGNYKSAYEIYYMLQFNYPDIYFICDNNCDCIIPTLKTSELIREIESFSCIFLSFNNMEDIKYYLKLIPSNKTISIDVGCIKNEKDAAEISSIIEKKKYNLILNISSMYDYNYIDSFNKAIEFNKDTQTINFHMGEFIKKKTWIYSVIPLIIIRNESLLSVIRINESMVSVKTNKAAYKVTVCTYGNNYETNVFVNNVKMPSPNYYYAINNYLKLDFYPKNQLFSTLLTIGKVMEELYSTSTAFNKQFTLN